MRYTLLEHQKDGMLFVGRLLLVALFLIFGWKKLLGFAGAVSYMAATGVPFPTIAAAIAVFMELFVGIAILFGFYTRPLALLLALYTLLSGFIGHHYWTLTGAEEYAAMINFYKNVGITGGLLVLVVVGPGKFSIDGK